MQIYYTRRIFRMFPIKRWTYIGSFKGAGVKKVIVLHVIDRRQFDWVEFGVANVGELPAQFEEEYKKAITEKANQQLAIVAKKSRIWVLR